MFENILRRLRGDAQGPPTLQSLELGLKIEAESDGIRIKKSYGDLRTGDRLLLSFTLDGENWERRVIAFQDEKNGMFIFTGSRPHSAIVIREDDVLEKMEFRGIQRSVYQSRRVSSDDRWSDTFYTSDSFFDCWNPLSPYYGHNFNNPLGLYSLYSHLTDSARRDDPPVNPSGLEQLRAPSPDSGGRLHFEPSTPNAPLDTNAPPTNPFDPRNIEVPLSPHGAATNAVQGIHYSGTNSVDAVEAKGDGKGFDTPREAEAPSVNTHSNNDAPSASCEPNAYN